MTIANNASKCPNCGGTLKYYDKVRRIVRTKGGYKRQFKVRRFRCVVCYKIYRELPRFVMPYKQYSTKIIQAVVNGKITSDTKGFEDYPCEMTMKRWKQK